MVFGTYEYVCFFDVIVETGFVSEFFVAPSFVAWVFIIIVMLPHVHCQWWLVLELLQTLLVRTYVFLIDLMHFQVPVHVAHWCESFETTLHITHIWFLLVFFPHMYFEGRELIEVSSTVRTHIVVSSIVLIFRMRLHVEIYVFRLDVRIRQIDFLFF